MLSGAPPFVDDDPMANYQNNHAGKIEFPRYFDPHAKDLIKGLLQPDITKRLGGLRNGVEDVKRHKWFAGLDWSALYACKIKAPFQPEVRYGCSKIGLLGSLDFKPPFKRIGSMFGDMTLLVLIIAHIANYPTSLCCLRRHAADTHNFESYPDSDEMPPAVRLEQDPFVDF